jgi:hypothetical protein
MDTHDRPPAVTLMRNLGKEPDPWQVEVLEGNYSWLLLNCCRQAGKSTVVAMLALAEAIFNGGSRVLLVSRSGRQSKLLFDIVVDLYRRLQKPLLERLTSDELWLDEAVSPSMRFGRTVGVSTHGDGDRQALASGPGTKRRKRETCPRLLAGRRHSGQEG